MRRNKYSRLPNKPVTRIVPSGSSLTLRYKQTDGRFKNINLRFFIEGKFPRPQIGKAFAEVFGLEMQKYSKDTVLNLAFSLSVFNKFLNWKTEDEPRCKINTTYQITYELLIEFSAYLGVSCKETTAASRYQAVARALDLMHTLRPAYLETEFKIPSNYFSHRSGERNTAESVLSLDTLVRIERAALEEVKQIREQHNRAVEMLESAAAYDAQARRRPKPRKFWRSVANALYYMVRVEGIAATSVGTRACLKANSQPHAGEIIGWYAPTSEEYFIPFLVLLYLRTAINVTSMFTLRRDCLEEHPLPVGLTKLRFEKPRSKPLSSKELSFPTNQPNGSVDLIQFLLKYTHPWVEHANGTAKNALFLYHCRTGGVREAGNCFADTTILRFIARNSLPHFTFAQLRPTIATLIYLQTKDIFRVQRLLGHASVRTTIKYIRGAAVHAEHYKAMSKGIDEMTEAITGISRDGKGVSVFIDPIADVLAAKVNANELSFDAGDRILKGGCNTLVGKCKDPWNSPQPGEIKGRVCRSLHACIFCENCWVFAEDLVDVIKYRISLEAEKSNMTSEMWELLHGAAVREINDSILSSFPTEAVAQAEQLAKDAPHINLLP